MQTFANCFASTFPRWVLGGETGALHLRSPIGASAKRTPWKWMMPLVSFWNPEKEPSGCICEQLTRNCYIIDVQSRVTVDPMVWALAETENRPILATAYKNFEIMSGGGCDQTDTPFTVTLSVVPAAVIASWSERWLHCHRTSRRGDSGAIRIPDSRARINAEDSQVVPGGHRLIARNRSSSSNC